MSIGAIESADWSVVAAQWGDMATVFVIAVVSVLLNSGALELIAKTDIDLNRELRAAGVRIGILSNASEGLEERLKSTFGIDVRWDAVIVSGTVGFAKPDPRIFTLAAERIGAPVPRCFFIDDRAEYLAGAAAVGMPHFHFTGDYAALRAALRDAGLAV